MEVIFYDNHQAENSIIKKNSTTYANTVREQPYVYIRDIKAR